MIRLVLLLSFCVLVRGETTVVSQCILNEGVLPINQYVHGCTNPPCLLPQLQDVVIDVVFRAPRTMRSMRTLATATVNFGITINIPYDLRENAVTCNFLTNTYCPVLKDEVVQYTLNMYIEPIFLVDTSALVEFRVVDDNNVAIWCIRVPIRIVPAVNPSIGIGSNSTASN